MLEYLWGNSPGGWADIVQPADIGWPTGNGKKLSCSQAQLGQATCLAVANSVQSKDVWNENL